MHPATLYIAHMNKLRQHALDSAETENDTDSVTKRKMDDLSLGSNFPEPKRFKVDEVSDNATQNGNQQTIIQQPTPQQTPFSPATVETKDPQVHVPHDQTQQQNDEIQVLTDQHNSTAQPGHNNITLVQTPQGIEVKFPRPQGMTTLDPQLFEALYRHFETTGPEDEFKSVFESRIDQATLDAARAVIEEPDKSESQLSQGSGTQLHVENSGSQVQSIERNRAPGHHQYKPLPQLYTGEEEYDFTGDLQVNGGNAIYDASLQSQQTGASSGLAQSLPGAQSQMQRLPVYYVVQPQQGQDIQPQFLQLQPRVPASAFQFLHPAQGQIPSQVTQPQAPSPRLQFLQTTQEQIEFQQTYEAEYSRLHKIQYDQDTLGRLIVSKRDLFHDRGMLFEDLAQLYWNLLEEAKEPERNCTDDWVEDLSMQLLALLQRMEEDEIEIQQLEIRYGEMTKELTRIF